MIVSKGGNDGKKPPANGGQRSHFTAINVSNHDSHELLAQSLTQTAQNRNIKKAYQVKRKASIGQGVFVYKAAKNPCVDFDDNNRNDIHHDKVDKHRGKYFIVLWVLSLVLEVVAIRCFAHENSVAGVIKR